MLVIRLKDAPEFIEFSLGNRFHHIAPVLSVIEKTATLTTRTELIKGLIVILHYAIDQLVRSQRLDVTFLAYTVQVAQLIEHQRCVIDKLKF